MNETDQAPPQEEFLSEDVKNCIDKLAQENSIKNYVLDVSPGSERGDNFLGIIVKVVVKGENASGEKKVLNFIVKSAPRAGMMRQMTQIIDIYNREIYLYETVLKKFSKFQQSKNISKPFNSFAKFHASLINETNETLIMENMKELGYELHDKRKTFNYDQVLIATKEYGKFHAISFALRDQQPELFSELSENLQDFFFGDAFTKGSMKEAIDGFCKRALASLDPVDDKVAYQKFQKFINNVTEKLPELVSSEAAGKYGVIGHGDCWKNNMLFKYADKEKPESPTDICFLDWQLSRVGSPALDLSYLIFTSTTKELREKYYKTLIQEYYNSLVTNLKELGSDPEKLFPFEVLEEQLAEFSSFGLYMAISVLMVIVSEGKDMPDIHNMKEEDMSELIPIEEAAKVYNARVRGIILDFVEYNYI